MQLKLKPVEEVDVTLLYNWANDIDVRNSAFETNLISFENHSQWFLEKIKSKCTYMYICYSKDVPIGQIRIEQKNYEGIIDYSISKEYRGKGYGTKIVQLLESKIFEDKISIKNLIGRVKFTNAPSQRVFEKLKYSKLFKEEYIEYEKKINNYVGEEDYDTTNKN